MTAEPKCVSRPEAANEATDMKIRDAKVVAPAQTRRAA